MAARELLTDDGGATAIEYALLAGLIATVIIVTVASLGRSVQGMYGEANTRLEAETED
jgi:pilus assembly protein Flp/PilA